ncbi:Transcriptional repressor SdpR [Planctomycetes bacterium Pan216]|uniref:Transcriptional repressor SdpR n=1 Tax=Kolteria novifilia TaxID=2527975 RepID=A0A518B084_9BACT|nr:Transcriptional repressor SdpR [Planctomycetes bacterium Pan216]
MQDRLDAERCSRMLKAVADPERLKIIQCLFEAPHNVGEVAEILKTEIANVSHHLGVLRNAGLVKDRRKGRHIVYSLNKSLFEESSDASVLNLGCCRLDFGQASPEG